jgi:hypothetical protein
MQWPIINNDDDTTTATGLKPKCSLINIYNNKKSSLLTTQTKVIPAMNATRRNITNILQNMWINTLVQSVRKMQKIMTQISVMNNTSEIAQKQNDVI